jgi:hypothetical protein
VPFTLRTGNERGPAGATPTLVEVHRSPDPRLPMAGVSGCIMVEREDASRLGAEPARIGCGALEDFSAV